jgi:hypothetical protein
VAGLLTCSPQLFKTQAEEDQNVLVAERIITRVGNLPRWNHSVHHAANVFSRSNDCQAGGNQRGDQHQHLQTLDLSECILVDQFSSDLRGNVYAAAEQSLITGPVELAALMSTA